MNLTDADEPAGIDIECRGHIVPRGPVRGGSHSEAPMTGREQMRGEGLERTADETGAMSRLDPFERRRRRWQYHLLVMSEILGIGMDATDIGRIAAAIEKYGDRFLTRVFTDGEMAYCNRRRVPAIHFAARFAAKEAAMKALGTGHTQNVLWRGIEVMRRGGPPQLRFHGGAERRFAALGARASLLTITHSQHLALAQVLLLGA
jgi:holo-[acyl-carrier protein] synthase